MRKKVEPKKILLIANQQIGDVLLSTPLLHVMRLAWPFALIDVLVYQNTAGILAGNPDCNDVITIAPRPSLKGYWQLLKRIFRRYDIAVTTQGNDRAHQYLLLAAPTRYGLIPDMSNHHRWKRAFCRAYTLLDNQLHTVMQNNLLATAMGIPLAINSHLAIVVPKQSLKAELSALDKLNDLLGFDIYHTDYVVIHPRPMWQYKRWTDDGWRSLLQHIIASGKRVVLTGGPLAEEQDYCEQLANLNTSNCVSVAGKTDFAILTTLLQNANAYVGPDTVTTHLAAACATPTLAIFGPSNPVKWGPWPFNHHTRHSPWKNTAALQSVGNVILLQGVGDCVPCHKAGCDNHNNSESRCLNELPAHRVITAFNALLSDLPVSPLVA